MSFISLCHSFVTSLNILTSQIFSHFLALLCFLLLASPVPFCHLTWSCLCSALLFFPYLLIYPLITIHIYFQSHFIYALLVLCWSLEMDWLNNCYCVSVCTVNICVCSQYELYLYTVSNRYVNKKKRRSVSHDAVGSFPLSVFCKDYLMNRKFKRTAVV